MVNGMQMFKRRAKDSRSCGQWFESHQGKDLSAISTIVALSERSFFF